MQTNLSTILEKDYPGFAYDLLTQQIQISNESFSTQSKISTINKLVKLYRHAIQVLELNSDRRYTYFNDKIHELMGRMDIIEELKKNINISTNQTRGEEQIIKTNINERKKQIQILLIQQQLDSSKIREIIKNSQHRMKKLSRNVHNNLKIQDNLIEERRKIRKMRTQASRTIESISSLSSIDLNLTTILQSPNKFIHSMLENDEYLDLIPTPERSLRAFHKRNVSECLENVIIERSASFYQPMNKVKVTRFNMNGLQKENQVGIV